MLIVLYAEESVGMRLGLGLLGFESGEFELLESNVPSESSVGPAQA